MVRSLCVLLLLSLTCLHLFSQKKELLTPNEFEDRISQPDIQILDVRTSQEYNSGHLKNAFQADWLKKDQFKDRAQYLDKHNPVYVYCGSGVRSNEAAKWLRNEGFDKVFELEKGYLGWKSANKPVEGRTAVRQMSITDYEKLLGTPGFLLIDFGAEWCPPCKKMEPVLQQLQLDRPSEFTLIKIDAGVHTNLMQHLKVENLPGFILYKNGKEIWRKEGLVSMEEFRSKIK